MKYNYYDVTYTRGVATPFFVEFAKMHESKTLGEKGEK